MKMTLKQAHSKALEYDRAMIASAVHRAAGYAREEAEQLRLALDLRADLRAAGYDPEEVLEAMLTTKEPQE